MRERTHQTCPWEVCGLDLGRERAKEKEPEHKKAMCKKVQNISARLKPLVQKDSGLRPISW